jgi:hypothetical protein
VQKKPTQQTVAASIFNGVAHQHSKVLVEGIKLASGATMTVPSGPLASAHSGNDLKPATSGLHFTGSVPEPGHTSAENQETMQTRQVKTIGNGPASLALEVQSQAVHGRAAPQAEGAKPSSTLVANATNAPPSDARQAYSPPSPAPQAEGAKPSSTLVVNATNAPPSDARQAYSPPSAAPQAEGAKPSSTIVPNATNAPPSDAKQAYSPPSAAPQMDTKPRNSPSVPSHQSDLLRPDQASNIKQAQRPETRAHGQVRPPVTTPQGMHEHAAPKAGIANHGPSDSRAATPMAIPIATGSKEQTAGTPQADHTSRPLQRAAPEHPGQMAKIDHSHQVSGNPTTVSPVAGQQPTERAPLKGQVAPHADKRHTETFQPQRTSSEMKAIPNSGMGEAAVFKTPAERQVKLHPGYAEARRSAENLPILTPKQTIPTGTAPNIQPEAKPIQINGAGTTATRLLEPVEEFTWDVRPLAPSTSSQPQMLTARPEMPAHLAQHLAHALHRSPDRPLEIALNPAELGRVRMTLAATDAGIVVTILADRPDTLDLMRRNINDLGQSFSELGYEDIAFAFGQNDDPSDTSSDPRSDDPDVLALDLDGAAPAPQDPIDTPRLAIVADGVDLRL